MDGLHNLVPYRRVTLSKHGKTYTFAVRQLADYARKEEAMLLRRTSPYAGLEAITSPEERARIARIVADIATRPAIVTFEEEQRFDNSLRGIAYSCWRCLSVDHPDEFPPHLPVEQGIQRGMDFVEWYGSDQLPQLIDAIHRAQEGDILGNSAGTAQPAPSQ